MRPFNWLLVSSFFGLFFGLSSYGLLNNNEGLYAEIAWEMITRGDFVIPHLNGVPYIEKPPLLYWLMAASFKLFGKSVFAARFIPAFMGFLTVLSLYFFYGRLNNRKAALQSALMLSTSLGFLIFSRMVFFDGVLTTFFTLSLLSFYLWALEGKKSFAYGFYGFLACALLTKGFLAPLLALLICGAFLWVDQRSFFAVFRLWHTGGMVLFLTLSLPWHLMASFAQEGFAWFYFINEHVMRFLNKRVPHDYYSGPFYYYLIRLPAYFLPWTFVLPFLKRQSMDQRRRLFLWLWFGLVLLFFTLSRAKANYYMILGMPPLAMIWGEIFDVTRFMKPVALGVSLLLSVTTFIAPHHNEKISGILAAKALPKQAKRIYFYKRFEDRFSSIVFYHGAPIPLIESQSADLLFGQRRDRSNLFLSLEDALKQGGYVFVNRRDLREFEARVRAKLLYQDKETSLYFLKGDHS